LPRQLIERTVPEDDAYAMTTRHARRQVVLILSQLLIASVNLAADGSLVVVAKSKIYKWSAEVIVLLYRCFTSITIESAHSKKSTRTRSACYLVCRGFREEYREEASDALRHALSQLHSSDVDPFPPGKLTNEGAERIDNREYAPEEAVGSIFENTVGTVTSEEMSSIVVPLLEPMWRTQAFALADVLNYRDSGQYSYFVHGMLCSDNGSFRQDISHRIGHILFSPLIKGTVNVGRRNAGRSSSNRHWPPTRRAVVNVSEMEAPENNRLLSIPLNQHCLRVIPLECSRTLDCRLRICMTDASPRLYMAKCCRGAGGGHPNIPAVSSREHPKRRRVITGVGMLKILRLFFI
jgi:hypothetical protein